MWDSALCPVSFLLVSTLWLITVFLPPATTYICLLLVAAWSRPPVSSCLSRFRAAGSFSAHHAHLVLVCIGFPTRFRSLQVPQFRTLSSVPHSGFRGLLGSGFGSLHRFEEKQQPSGTVSRVWDKKLGLASFFSESAGSIKDLKARFPVALPLVSVRPALWESLSAPKSEVKIFTSKDQKQPFSFLFRRTVAPKECNSTRASIKFPDLKTSFREAGLWKKAAIAFWADWATGRST